MRQVTVFCGASDGVRQEYQDAAREVGRHLAEAGLALVYGGASTGLMGVLADSALRHGAKVTGVIPAELAAHEIAHCSLSEMHVVDGMHERKKRMAALGDAYVALPGGLGTAEEFFEVATWAQLGMHAKPCVLLNVAGFFDPLLAFLRHAAAEGFIRQRYLDNILVAREPAALLSTVRFHRELPGLFAGRHPASR